MTHDDKRHGTIDVFAALHVGTGEVHTRRHKGHTGADVLAFSSRSTRRFQRHTARGRAPADRAQCPRRSAEVPTAAGTSEGMQR